MSLHNPRCFANHIGMWLMEPRWFQQAVAAIKSGAWRVEDAAKTTKGEAPTLHAGTIVRESSGYPLYTLTNDGIAVIEIDGPLMKGDSRYGGTSTVRARTALRTAGADPEVAGILLHIDSPGGHVAGTMELADEVKATDKLKPVMAHADDLVASAAYWVASSARRLAINTMGEAGSIGTVAVVEDWSKAYQAEGVTVHVISTGAYKGAFATGTEVTADHLAYLQDLVDGTNQHFLAAVQKGRGLSAKKVAEIADGRVFSAAKALELGLVDAVQSLDRSMADLRREAGIKAATPKRDRMAAVLHVEGAQD